MKLCARCKQMVDRSAFPKHKKAADGLGSYCRPCIRDFNAWYLQTAEGKAKRLAWNNRYRQENKSKARAHGAVSVAVRLGTLVKSPCEVCSEHKAEAHHDDYGKPLEVRWLCDLHHKEWHKHNNPKVPATLESRRPFSSTGVRHVNPSKNGKFVARHRGRHIGTFPTIDAAKAALATLEK